MRSKVEFAAPVDHHLITGWALVTMAGRVINRFTTLRLSGFALQQSIDKATDRAVDAAVQASNDKHRVKPLRHRLFGPARRREPGSLMRLSLGQIALTLFSSSMVIALGIIILVAGNAASIADDRLGQDSPSSRNQAAALDHYTRQLER